MISFEADEAQVGKTTQIAGSARPDDRSDGPAPDAFHHVCLEPNQRFNLLFTVHQIQSLSELMPAP